jgi:short-subunit dehydrogenase
MEVVRKTIFITGIARGLGHELFLYAIEKGYRVCGLVRKEESIALLNQYASEHVKLIAADLSDDASMEQIRTIVGNERIDLLINNAGIGGETFTLDTVTPGEVMELLNIHCLGVLRVTKALVGNLQNSDRPIVLNMNSRFGSLAYQYNGMFKHLDVSYSYRIAKAAQNMLTNCLRNELGDRIEFVSVTPGKLITRLAQKDAQLSPAEAAQNIIDFWEQGLFKTENGIVQVKGDLTPW